MQTRNDSLADEAWLRTVPRVLDLPAPQAHRRARCRVDSAALIERETHEQARPSSESAEAKLICFVSSRPGAA